MPLWSVRLFFYRVRCIRDTSQHTGLLMHSWTSVLRRRILGGTNAHHKVCTSGSRMCLINFLLNVTWLNDSLGMHVALYALFPCLSLSNIVAFGSSIIHMTEWVCQWRPFWIPRGHSFQTGPPYLQNPKEYRRLKRTSAPPHVSRLVTVPLCRNPRGKHLENPTHHPGNTQGLRKRSILGTFGCSTAPENSRPPFCSSKTVWYLSQEVTPAVP